MTDSRRLKQQARTQAAQRRAEREARRRRTSFAVSLAIPVLLIIGLLLTGLGGLGSPASDAGADDTASPSPSVTASTPVTDSTCAPAGTPRADNLSFETFDPKAADGVTSLAFETNCGPLSISLDSRAPKTSASMAFLTKAGFFSGISCHRLTTAGIFVLQCGDPKGNGTGGPGYVIPDENLPTVNDNGVAVYPRGTVAMANAGPGTGGSQFFIVYKDSPLPPNYTVWGQIGSGLDTVDYVAEGGVSGGGSDGAPARPLLLTSATLKP